MRLLRLGAVWASLAVLCSGAALAQDAAQLTMFNTGLTIYPVGTAFAGYAGGPAIGPVTLDVTPTQQDGAWTAVGDVPWLTVTPAADSGPGQVQVTVNPAGLLAGRHQASVTLYASGAAAHLIRVPVVLTLTAPPTDSTPMPPGVHLTVRSPLTVRIDRRAGDTSTSVFVTVNKNEAVTVNGAVVP